MARVKIEDAVAGEIGAGLLVFLGVDENDTEKDLSYIVEKTLNLRIFEDAEGKMNLSVMDTAGALLVVSQFTLLGDCRKGRRPSFIAAARPEKAIPFYERAVALFKESGLHVATGKFQAEMAVELVNDGPVTLLLDSNKAF